MPRTREALGGLIDATGHKLDQAPTFSGNTSLEYTYALGSGGALSARVDYSYQTRIYFDPSNLKVMSQGDYGLLNLDVGYSLPYEAHKIRIDAWAKNLANTQYITGASTLARLTLARRALRARLV